MNGNGTIHIIIGVVLFLPVLIVTQMLLPFPYGVIFGLGGSVIILVFFVRRGIKKGKESYRPITLQKNCKNCGAENPSNNKFCIKCGKRLE